MMGEVIEVGTDNTYSGGLSVFLSVCLSLLLLFTKVSV